MTRWNSIVEVDFSSGSRATLGKDTAVRFCRKEQIVDPLADLLRRWAGDLIGRAVVEECEMFLERHSCR